jgi:hypothetical protein
MHWYGSPGLIALSVRLLSLFSPCLVSSLIPRLISCLTLWLCNSFIPWRPVNLTLWGLGWFVYTCCSLLSDSVVPWFRCPDFLTALVFGSMTLWLTDPIVIYILYAWIIDSLTNWLCDSYTSYLLDSLTPGILYPPLPCTPGHRNGTAIAVQQNMASPPYIIAQRILDRCRLHLEVTVHTSKLTGVHATWLYQYHNGKESSTTQIIGGVLPYNHPMPPNKVGSSGKSRKYHQLCVPRTSLYNVNTPPNNKTVRVKEVLLLGHYFILHFHPICCASKARFSIFIFDSKMASSAQDCKQYKKHAAKNHFSCVNQWWAASAQGFWWNGIVCKILQ